jgi:hypothetical protein
MDLMRGLLTSAALVASVAGAGCYSVPDVRPADDGGTTEDGRPRDTGPSEMPDATDDAPVVMPDTGRPPDAACTGILCPCSNNGSCASDVCAQAETIGNDVFGKVGAFCTQGCCTSVDCPAGLVCYAPGTGGQYCVEPSWIGRGMPSTTNTLGGVSCTSNSDCRSGLCAGSTCADTCCSFASTAAECNAPALCVFGAFPGQSGVDSHYAAHCGASGPDAYGSPCTYDTDCQGGLCYQSGGGGNCTQPCRSQSECGQGNGCQLDERGNDVYAACFPLVMGQGSGALGDSCSNDNACSSFYCGATGQCSSVCFADSDCSAVSSWRCTTLPASVASGSILMLACGP